MIGQIMKKCKKFATRELRMDCQNHGRNSIPLVSHYPTDSSVNKAVQYKDVDDGIKLPNCEQMETGGERETWA